MRTRLPIVVALACFVTSVAILYGDVVTKLVADWAHDDNYSHGFLVVPLSAYLAWERRVSLRDAIRHPSILGLLVVAGSLALFIGGTLGAELFTTRVSLVGLVAGTVLFVFGWQHVRVLAFPIATLLLMIPIPVIVFNQVAFPLQLLASKFGEAALELARIPVLREGNVIVLANTTLEVAEACSGIRSLISLLTLAIVYGYFADGRVSVRAVAASATVPIAIVTNGLRVAGTGIAAHYYGPAAAEGFFHTFSGWLVFVLALILLFGFVRTVSWAFPDRVLPGSEANPNSERQIA